MPDRTSPATPRREPETKECGSYRRKWRPILSEYPLAPPVDWICPICNEAIDSNITGVHRCWRCGLAVRDNSTGPKPEHIRQRQWSKFGRRYP